MMTHTSRHALAVLAALACLHGAALGQAARAGKIYVSNTSGEAITLTCIAYVDESGVRRSVRGGAWTIKPDARGYLEDLGTRMVASRFEFTLQTAAGKTDWNVARLDSAGDLPLPIDRALLARHQARLVPAVAGPALAGLAGGKAPSSKDVDAAVGKILGAAVAHAVASQEPANLVEAILVEVARKARDELIEGALKDVFKDRPLRDIQAARRVIALGLDGKLNTAALNREQAREELIGRLRAADPHVGASAELADFIHTVLQARRR